MIGFHDHAPVLQRPVDGAPPHSERFGDLGHGDVPPLIPSPGELDLLPRPSFPEQHPDRAYRTFSVRCCPSPDATATLGTTSIRTCLYVLAAICAVNDGETALPQPLFSNRLNLDAPRNV
jgi:hypothetical protein